MKIFRPGESDYLEVEKDGRKITVMKKESFEKFNPSILDLGDITQDSSATNAICAVVDLQGFTNFCKQIDPHLSVPLYLSGFLEWIFATIRRETLQTSLTEGIDLWHDLPFYIKFLGDGLLILWDTSSMDSNQRRNIIISMDTICDSYLKEFLPYMRRKVTDPPEALRCGITRGTIYSVGDGNDFVGPCINLAVRLQKLPGAKFAFARRGFDPEENEEYAKRLVLKKIPIRGMQNEELVYLRKKDFDAMDQADRDFYHDP